MKLLFDHSKILIRTGLCQGGFKHWRAKVQGWEIKNEELKMRNVGALKFCEIGSEGEGFF
jgi:hypothetical protein